MTKQQVKLTKERETKNKVRYNDGNVVGPIYLPKTWFDGDVPEEVTVDVEW